MLQKHLFITPNLSILPEAQKALFVKLKDTPSHFTLYGGTAIALQLGHRISIDFDFFSNDSFDPDKLYNQIPYLKESEILQKDINTLTCLVSYHNDPVKISFFGDLNLSSVYPPRRVEGPHIRIASLVDLGATKVAVIQKRASLKDYLDIDALINQGDLDLETLIAAGSIVYGKQFNPQLTFKALTYFKGGDLESLPIEIQKRFINTLKTLKEEKIRERLLEFQRLNNPMISPC